MFNKFAQTLAVTAALAVSSTAAFAGSSYIMPGQAQNLRASVKLDLVRAEQNGTVSVFNKAGTLLGQTNVKAGASTDVLVPFSHANDQSVLVVYTADGSDAPLAQAVATVD
nr:hypothetical protein [uncultured Celeribacter sp.]